MININKNVNLYNNKNYGARNVGEKKVQNKSLHKFNENV